MGAPPKYAAGSHGNGGGHPPRSHPRVPSKLIRNTDESQDTLSQSCASTQGRGNVACTGHTQQRYCYVSQTGHDLGAVAFADLTAVLVKGDVPDPVQAVFDCPMATGQIQYAHGICTIRGETGNPVDGFGVLFVVDQFCDVALDAKALCDMREAKVIVELGAGPNMAQFQTAMGFIGGGVCRGEKR